MEKEIKGLKLDLGLMEISRDHNKTLLNSCENALSERDEIIRTLKAERDDLLKSAAELLDNLDAAWHCITYFKNDDFDDDLKEFMASKKEAIKLMQEKQVES